MAGLMFGVGVQPRWLVSAPTSTSANSSSSNGRLRIKMAVTPADEKKKAYTLQKSEEAFNKAKQYPSCRKVQYHIVPFKSQGTCRTIQPQILCAMNMTAGQFDESGKLKFELFFDKAKQIWDNSPQPVRSFPWNRAFDNFIQLILDLTLAVVKYLSIPLFAVSCISELSYCAHERKLYFTLVPFFLGAAVTGALRAAAEEASPSIKNATVPWHLVAIVIFFTLLKLPGPYYPYWGRLFIPHFANGALFRTLWFAFLWYRRPQKLSETSVAAYADGNTQDNL